MSFLNAVSFLLLIGSISAVQPAFPPHAVSGGTVIAALHFVSGNVKKVDILYGEEPFVGSCKAALPKWSEDAGVDNDRLVIVHFRQPNLYEMGDAKEIINLKMKEMSLPYPRSIIHPAFPPNALGQGSVILKIDISDNGKVTNVQAIESMGILTDSSIKAVQQWDFEPAKDRKGKATQALAYVVMVYRFPIVVK
jgi:TonB family protein